MPHERGGLPPEFHNLPPGLYNQIAGGAEEQAGLVGGLPGGGGPPPSIQLPAPSGVGPSQDPAAGRATSAARGGQDGSDLVRKAMDLFRQALEVEPDDEDKLLLEKLLTDGQKYLANQQKLGDQVTGAGPGVKLVRKLSQRQRS